MSAQGEFSYFKGFGDQPGERIEDFVNAQDCLSSCIVSCNDLDDEINIGDWGWQDVDSRIAQAQISRTAGDRHAGGCGNTGADDPAVSDFDCVRRDN